MDASPVLEFSEHVLGLVATAVEYLVVDRRVFPVGFWRHAGGNAALDESLSEPVCVITPVAQQRFSLATSGGTAWYRFLGSRPGTPSMAPW